MTDFERFVQFASGKSFSLIGAGVSNLPLVPFLFRSGAERIVVRDLRISSESPNALEAKNNGADLKLGEEYLDDLSEDVIIRSPGIRPDKTEFIIAEKKGSRITCETELFMEFCSAKTYGVTGSDGKTTTTTLVARMLEGAGKIVLLGGNIGKAMLPMITETNEDDTCAVMELSSFQLMNCRHSPDVAVITNLAENHLDWHHGFSEYLDAKKNILNHQDQSGVAVLNFDNAITRSLRGNGVTRFFSEDPIVKTAGGKEVFCQNGLIKVSTGGESETVLDCSLIKVPGRHNIQNYMASIAAVLDDVPTDVFAKVADAFTGVEHRMELVRVLNGISFYNSSIDSSPSRTAAALNSFNEKVIMIAGGYDKNLNYGELGNTICQHVKTLILCGATADKIDKAVTGSSIYQIGAPEIIHCDSLEKCVVLAFKSADEGDIVILTPASASFDQFKNFEERGKAFKRMVMAL